MRVYEIIGTLPPLRLLYCGSRKKAKKAIRNLTGCADDVPKTPGFTSRCGTERGVVYVVAIDARSDAASELALLAHEATHVCEWYFEDIREDEPASEERAYVMQAICQHLFEEHLR